MIGLFGTMRLPFLPLNPICVLLGAAAAYYTGMELYSGAIWLALVGAVAANISVNALNEYTDFRNGLDLQTIRTPFSGGSGTLPAHPELAGATLALGVLSLMTVVVIGLWFLIARGPELLPVGIAGVLLIAFYSTWIVRHPVICLLAPGLGFGPLMVLGTAWVATGEYSTTVLAASLVPFFLVSNLLLLNQFPDVEADASVGRRTLPIAIGRRRASYVYLVFAGLGAAALVACIGAGWLPAAAGLGLIGFGGAVPVFLGALRHGADVERLQPFMALNVVITLVTPVLVAGGLYFST